MKKNEIYTLQCEDDTRLGAGIVRLDNQVIFVPDLLIGELADIRIVKVDKKYAFGKIERIIEPSINRIETECEHARVCGGCNYQHIKYTAQLEMKTRQMTDLFHRSVEESIQVLPAIGCDEPFYYRNKAQFPIQIINDEVKMGFYRKHSNQIVPCDECKIQSREINEIYQYIKERMTVKTAMGLRHLFIRASYYTKEAQVVFIGRNEKNLKSLVNELSGKFNIVSILFNYNTRNDNVILGDTYKVLYGRDYIYEQCLGLKIQLHFKSFFQVNPLQMEKLYSKAIEMANLDGTQTCIDLYSGTGTIGLSISKKSKTVLGVEIVEEAVMNAKENARINNITNCNFLCQDATEFANEYKDKKVDVVFVDPPRKGMTEQGINDIVTMQPDTLIYVSCNPETLARDLKIFKEKGYICQMIQPVDMFAQTLGLENIAKLVKEKD